MPRGDAVSGICERVTTIAAQQGVRPEDVSRAAGEVAAHFDISQDEALDAMAAVCSHATAGMRFESKWPEP